MNIYKNNLDLAFKILESEDFTDSTKDMSWCMYHELIKNGVSEVQANLIINKMF